jgi:outer membrane protein OmpA-like peptidoglycan-associated protein/opacity protein-like surface antigen
MRRTILAIVAVLLAAAGPTFAGGEKGQLELGGFVGYGWLDDYQGLNPKNHVLFGGRLGYFLTHHWELEASYKHLRTSTEFEPPIVTPNFDLSLNAWRGNLLFNFGEADSKVRPFLTAGGGTEKIDLPDATLGSDSHHFGWNAGGGLRFFLSPKVNLRLEGRYVGTKVEDINNSLDTKQNNVEAMAGLGFLIGGHHHEKVVEAPPPAPPPNQPPTVSCAADRAQILPGETVAIHATAADPENGPLTYAWTTTGGTVNGTDATGTLDFTGATPPVTATVTVRVTDDHGNTATCDAAVQLMEPVKPAEAVSCTAGNFPRNLARLSNVDKACLDDVAQKLTSDPRAHVVVIGHSDSHETVKGVDQKRAEAVRDYLSRERSIEVSRVTVRAAGTANPVGTDAAGNRRVEIWFVPDGAKDPD